MTPSQTTIFPIRISGDSKDTVWSLVYMLYLCFVVDEREMILFFILRVFLYFFMFYIPFAHSEVLLSDSVYTRMLLGPSLFDAS